MNQLKMLMSMSGWFVHTRYKVFKSTINTGFKLLKYSRGLFILILLLYPWNGQLWNSCATY